MAITVTARNVNRVLEELIWKMRVYGVPEASRNGPVLRIDEPVVVKYLQPRERVLFSGVRDANPFFHLFESLWMLAGRNDVEFVAQFAKQLAVYSDDGKTLNGAYGHRWRYHFDVDQVEAAIAELRRDAISRRVVIGMWDPSRDLPLIAAGADVPCNLALTFQIKEEGLVLTVFNRSNDIVWGLAGANAVHFSILQDYVASALGLPMGPYYQITTNAHMYKNEQGDKLLQNQNWPDYYTEGGFRWEQRPLFINKEAFDDDLNYFMQQDLTHRYQTAFFSGTAVPMLRTWTMRRDGEDITALRIEANTIKSPDWQIAVKDWLNRRAK